MTLSKHLSGPRVVALIAVCFCSSIWRLCPAGALSYNHWRSKDWKPEEKTTKNLCKNIQRKQSKQYSKNSFLPVYFYNNSKFEWILPFTHGQSSQPQVIYCRMPRIRAPNFGGVRTWVEDLRTSTGWSLQPAWERTGFKSKWYTGTLRPHTWSALGCSLQYTNTAIPSFPTN